MAAVLCLIFLPALSAILFMFGASGGELDLANVLACLAFLLLGSGMVVGAMNMSKAWEEEPLEDSDA
ncbi:MAG: hypothetical protein JWO36_3132 [Myxococcales bacterium]|nr:hypothetical protein [Myxococcales bacterium]